MKNFVYYGILGLLMINVGGEKKWKEKNLVRGWALSFCPQDVQSESEMCGGSHI